MTPTLSRPTLVLNRHWQPVRVTTVARALVMLWNEAARVVDTESFSLLTWQDWAERMPDPLGPCIRAARLRIAVPEVVHLSRYDRMPNAAVTFSRRNVAKRDHHTCQYCGDQPGWDGITVDHVVPRSQGGPTNWTNCVAACVRCNSRKADRTPEQARMLLRMRPTRPDWKPVFASSGHRVPCWSVFLSEAPSRSLSAS